MTKHGYFTKVENELLRSGFIKPHELAVYLNIKSRQGNKKSAWPSHSTIARETSMSVSKVKACIKKLDEQGLLKVRNRSISPGRMTSNEYFAANFLNGVKVPQPQPPEGYKEDSNQEYSSTKSSNTSNKRDWSGLKPEKQATSRQIAYLDDLVSNYGEPAELFQGTGDIDWGTLSQTEADSWIEMYYVHSKRIEM